MIDRFREVLMLLGFVVLLVLVVILIYALYCVFKDEVERIRKRWYIRHRFSKPPLAKCYCRDCTEHGPGGYCKQSVGGRATADEWFCWMANPNIKEAEPHGRIKRQR